MSSKGDLLDRRSGYAGGHGYCILCGKLPNRTQVTRTEKTKPGIVRTPGFVFEYGR